jgi:hypothetical protein
MTEQKNDDLKDQHPTSPTWKPEPPSVDLDPQPLPDQGSVESQEGSIPPARSGQSANNEDPVQAEGGDNPIHHSGRVPNSPLTK